ncbi:alcohol dehydrogenase [Escherichia coli]|nr:alcohol dehydrogenase [Escherichia coli]
MDSLTTVYPLSDAITVAEKLLSDAITVAEKLLSGGIRGRAVIQYS